MIVLGTSRAGVLRALPAQSREEGAVATSVARRTTLCSKPSRCAAVEARSATLWWRQLEETCRCPAWFRPFWTATGFGRQWSYHHVLAEGRRGAGTRRCRWRGPAQSQAAGKKAEAVRCSRNSLVGPAGGRWGAPPALHGLIHLWDGSCVPTLPPCQGYNRDGRGHRCVES